jgi:hypothetical protein
VKEYSPKFLVAELQAQRPDLYQKYLVNVPRWENKFLLKSKYPDELPLGETFQASIQLVDSVLDSIDDHSKVQLVNEPKLILTHLRGEADWNQSICEAKLKIAIGNSEGLEGLCTWRRYETSTAKFDSTSFAADEPELTKEFLSAPEKKTYTSAKKLKA